MCRIYGCFGPQPCAPEILSRVGQAQRHGGPDAHALVTTAGWALGSERLAIQGVDGGVQPFAHQNMYAVFNGEIYNHRDLRAQLASHGYVIRDRCDGAVILPLYELYGERFVEYLDGMFAIALIDARQERKLLLACDPCAIKALYYHWDAAADTLYFASELSGLLHFPIAHDLRLEAVDEYLVGRSIWYDRTFFAQIQVLTPSSLLRKTWEKDPVVTHYQSQVGSLPVGREDLSTLARDFDARFEREIVQMTQTDVPVCVVTSGGLDSSYVTAVAARHLPRLECFHIAYDGQWPADERHYAQEVAAACGATYHEVLIRESAFPDLVARTVAHLGQPNSAPHAVSTYALFQAIHQAGYKAALTGEGADEFFAGYERFRSAAYSPQPDWLDTYFDALCATTRAMRQAVYSVPYGAWLATKGHDVLGQTRQTLLADEQTLQSRLRALLNFDQTARFPSYILRRVDHLSMAHAVEVRVPFCQPGVVQYARALPDAYLANPVAVKRILYAAAQEHLPTSVLNRPKQPFTLPIVAMLRPGFVLFDLLVDTLHSQTFLQRGFFHLSEIDRLLGVHAQQPSAAIADVLWSMMILELWLQHLQADLSL